MSRSFKKVPIWKDNGDKDYNKRFRRVNKQRVKEEKYPLKMNELIDSHDVCDFKFYNEESESYRK